METSGLMGALSGEFVKVPGEGNSSGIETETVSLVKTLAKR
jgi:hypothetical protein